MPHDCPFCDISVDSVLLENGAGVVIADKFPLSRDHALVIPRKHVESVFELPSDDQFALWQLVTEARQLIRADGFNVGVNDGSAAGQTVRHAHIHIIPRRHGDMDDPRGGIRWIMPDKARYW